MVDRLSVRHGIIGLLVMAAFSFTTLMLGVVGAAPRLEIADLSHIGTILGYGLMMGQLAFVIAWAALGDGNLFVRHIQAAVVLFTLPLVAQYFLGRPYYITVAGVFAVVYVFPLWLLRLRGISCGVPAASSVKPLQFSIAWIFGLTTLVAVLIAVIQAMPWEFNSDYLELFVAEAGFLLFGWGTWYGVFSLHRDKYAILRAGATLILMTLAVGLLTLLRWQLRPILAAILFVEFLVLVVHLSVLRYLGYRMIRRGSPFKAL